MTGEADQVVGPEIYHSIAIAFQLEGLILKRGFGEDYGKGPKNALTHGSLFKPHIVAI